MLKDDDSKCHDPHGHEYVLEVSIQGDVKDQGTEAGMVMNFGTLKALMMEEVHDHFDHKFIADSQDPRLSLFVAAVGSDAVRILPYPPTAENLAVWIWERISAQLPEGITVTEVSLKETSNCTAILTSW